MPSRKNKWRKRGRLEFKRKTARFHDGSPMGHDNLFIRVHNQDCAIVNPWDPNVGDYCRQGRTLSVLPSLGSTYRIVGPVSAAKLIRASLRGLQS